ncbi:MAG: hypothetical protein E6G34_01975 [Actinobacteria bacterium]|nr:MAG: hypothetical protein E6G34_01975 [Actinomycetota bacterium]
MTAGAEDTTSLLRELLRWQRAVATPQVRATIDGSLGSASQRRAYDAANGQRSLAELADLAGVSTAAVGKWSKRWRQLGIASLSPEGRLEHLGDLDSFGLNITPAGGVEQD